MTTLQRYQGIEEILQKLYAVSFRRKVLALLTGLTALTAVVLGSLLVVALALGYWPDQPPGVLRWACLVAALAAWAGTIGWFLLRPLVGRLTPAQTARYVEQAMPQVHNNLINSVLLSRDRDQASPELVQQAILEAARETRRVDLNQSISLTRLQRWGIAAAASALLLAGFGTLQGAAMKRGLLAAINPAGYVPLYGTVELIDLQPGDTTVFAGQSLTISARIRNDQAEELRAEVIVEGMDNPRAMVPNTSRTAFTCPLPAVEETFRYKVRIGNSGWPTDKEYYTVTVVRRVEVEGLDIQYDYPAYTHLPPRSVRNADGSIEAPVGSRATVTLRLSAPVPTAILDVRDEQPEPMGRPSPRRCWSRRKAATASSSRMTPGTRCSSSPTPAAPTASRTSTAPTAGTA